jgi:uncharacterized protein (TIGR02186 family)
VRRLGLLLAGLALGVAAPVAATAPVRLITDISQNRIDIVYTFKGAELLVFGAIQYPRGSVPDERPGLAIVVRGPAEPITLRKKGRVAGVWINTDSVRFDTAPGFYAVATSAPIKTLVDERNASIWEIGLDYLQLSPTTGDTAQIAEFTRGLIDLRRRSGLWSEQQGRIGLTQNILYQARIAIPSAVPVGSYTAEIYLIRHGKVIARSATPITIDKSGFERWVYVVAQNDGLAYGIAAVALALLAGWGAGLVVRRT